MSLSDEDRKRIYEEEKAREEAREKIEKGKKQKETAQIGKGCAFLLIIGVVLAIILYFVFSNGDKQGTSDKSSGIIKRGSSVVLTSKEGGAIPLAITKEAYKEMRKYWLANDKVGMAQMALSGTMFMVNSGTKALMIDRTTFEYEVRIQDGEHIGKSGWTASDLVKLAE